jgi:SAM-dependent methyltransferase
VDLYADFAPIYDAWAGDMSEDVPFYVELAREADGPVVELAVGTGRVAIPVARETGKRVIGVDVSPAMLSVAGERAAEAGVELDLREADMRDLELDEPAALVYCPYRSLLHLPTWRERRRVFERVAAALAPGGRFAWNAFVFDPHLGAMRDGFAAEHSDSGIWELTVLDPAESRIDVTAFVGAPGARDAAKFSLWWVSKGEWEGLIDVAGLEVEALYGWFDRRPFDGGSREFVWVTRKPG